MARFILDASALLSLIQKERGSERVTQALEQGACVVSAVNISEAMAKLVTKGVQIEHAEIMVRGIPAEVVPCDEEIALKAGALASVGKPLGLSLGDRICLATAMVHDGLVLTTDQEWRKLRLSKVRIEIVRDPRAKTKGH